MTWHITNLGEKLGVSNDNLIRCDDNREVIADVLACDCGQEKEATAYTVEQLVTC